MFVQIDDSLLVRTWNRDWNQKRKRKRKRKDLKEGGEEGRKKGYDDRISNSVGSVVQCKLEVYICMNVWSAKG